MPIVRTGVLRAATLVGYRKADSCWIKRNSTKICSTTPMPSPLRTAVAPRRLEFRDAQSVEMYREVLMAEIQQKKRVNGTERIYEYIKELAASPLDLGFAETWETVIKYADDGLERIHGRGAHRGTAS